MNMFSFLKEAQQVTKKWIPSYNNERPYSSFKGLPPIEFAKIRSENKSNGKNVFFRWSKFRVGFKPTIDHMLDLI